MFNPFRRPADPFGVPATAPQTAPPERKASRPLLATHLPRHTTGPSQDYASLCREGFARNPIAHRCVRLIAESAASVPLCCEDARVGALLTRGLPGRSGVETLEEFYGYLQLGGNAFLEAVLSGDDPIALIAHRPDTMKMGTDAKGQATGWTQETSGRTRRFPRDTATARCALFHLRLFNPADECHGLSPLSAAAQAVEMHNRGAVWAKALLENSARPSGALVHDPASGERLTDDQFERLKSELEQNFTGPLAAGRPLVLEGGLDWKSISLSPTDMDFIQLRREAAREIALAFGVPPMLLGLPGDNTYANYREANQAFWRQTIIPLVTKTAAGLQGWLSAFFEDGAQGNIKITPDLDAVPALAEERAVLWKRLSDARFISEDEARGLAGLAPQVNGKEASS
ncbi:MAG: phage portal protein [Litorimonas sp.]